MKTGVMDAGAVLIWSLTFVLPASMRAAGDVKFAMIISVISMWIFRIGAAYLFAGAFGIGEIDKSRFISYFSTVP